MFCVGVQTWSQVRLLIKKNEGDLIMGYTTTFKGELKFNRELTASDIVLFTEFFGGDFRDHPNWEGADGLYYCALEFNDNYTGIRHDDSEKTHALEEQVNVVIYNINKTKPDLILSGELLAQGEDIGDRWFLRMIDGNAVKVPIEIKGKKIVCPHCGEHFIIES